MYRSFLTLLCAFTFLSFQGQNIDLETFSTGFNAPINIKNAGDARLFVVERAGLIQIVNSDGSKNATPFLNINPSVSDSGGERGLLGLAFHPDYANNGFFYVNYINNNNNSVISRFSRDPSNDDLADSSSELQLLTFTQPFSNHNGGDMAFGPDGYLYIASGDGGSGGDPGNRAQSLTTLLGKLLRIDVDASTNGTYGIPPDNPFVADNNALDEIWAYGLRNPWRFSFDSDNGDLWIADVGQNAIEEINLTASTSAGLNYGWRCYEGNTVFDQSDNCPMDSSLTFPIANYSHSGNGVPKCSITGGYRYRGSAYPNFNGLYFFADFCSNEIGTLEQTATGWTMAFSSPFSGVGITTFGQDIEGELYVGGIQSGTIYKLVDTTLGIEDFKRFDVKTYPNPIKNNISIHALQSSTILQSADIYDIQGTLVYSLADINSVMITFSMDKFMSGIYIIKITNSENNSIFKKIIKY